MDTYMTECVRVCVCVRMCARVCVCGGFEIYTYIYIYIYIYIVYLCIFMSGCHLLDLHRIPTFPTAYKCMLYFAEMYFT